MLTMKEEIRSFLIAHEDASLEQIQSSLNIDFANHELYRILTSINIPQNKFYDKSIAEPETDRPFEAIGNLGKENLCNGEPKNPVGNLNLGILDLPEVIAKDDKCLSKSSQRQILINLDNDTVINLDPSTHEDVIKNISNYSIITESMIPDSAGRDSVSGTVAKTGEPPLNVDATSVENNVLKGKAENSLMTKATATCGRQSDISSSNDDEAELEFLGSSVTLQAKKFEPAHHRDGVSSFTKQSRTDNFRDRDVDAAQCSTKNVLISSVSTVEAFSFTRFGNQGHANAFEVPPQGAEPENDPSSDESLTDSDYVSEPEATHYIPSTNSASVIKTCVSSNSKLFLEAGFQADKLDQVFDPIKFVCTASGLSVSLSTDEIYNFSNNDIKSCHVNLKTNLSTAFHTLYEESLHILILTV